MPDEKHRYEVPEDPPIPTYEEATSSQPRSRFGPEEVSDDAERQGLLGTASIPSRTRNGNYQAPSAATPRASEDSEAEFLSLDDGEEETAALRQEMEEMEILDPEEDESGRSRRERLRGRFSKRFQQITHRLSRFHFPRIPWPRIQMNWYQGVSTPSIPDQFRPGCAIVARICGLVLIAALVYLLVVSELMPLGSANFGQPFNPEWVRQQVQEGVDTGRIVENLKYITSYDHVAGSEGSFYLGQWIEGKFKEAGLDTFWHDEYYVYLNYPTKDGRRVAIVDPPEKRWQAKLEEESAYNPPKAQTLAFHGLSASGNVTGPLIYANYGHKDDFQRLNETGVSVEGAVVLMRYYGTQSDRSMKVRAAQDAGAAGVLIYSDPAEDGFKKGDVWPTGRWRPQDAIQRGTVALSSWIAGDVLTPGVPSTKDAPRMPKDKNPALPKIPSLPLAWRDAQHLLHSLQNIGPEVPKSWIGATPNVGSTWYSGHPSSSPKVNLQNLQDEVEKQPIQNIFGSIIGIEEKAKKIIIGNHRDSWCFGAADPGSGTAVILEVARVLGDLRAQGWRPLRTIEFASWDAEEYNIIGSTEHVEANIADLRTNAIAYLNIDVGVTGDKIWANGSPLLRQAWLRALGRVTDPKQNVTLKELWMKDNNALGGLGAGSDYLAFQDMAGTSSLDFGFSGPEHGDMYHSCYETFNWVAKYVDPGFSYHNLLAQVWALLILELAQEHILPMRLDEYAEHLLHEYDNLVEWARKLAKETAYKKFDDKMFLPIRDAVEAFVKLATKFHTWEDHWYNMVYGTNGFEAPGLTLQRLAHNEKMGDLDTRLLDLPTGEKGDREGDHGIPNRNQFKHVIFGPDASGSGYDAAIFPFVRDAIDNGDWGLAERQVRKTADIILKAAESLRG
ncbi:N-acetylated-alpha-linked acidic dipeptidase 2 [Sporormia fimetaria CBS 119925]|uniref:N-acetylated-alpha-linked acidic dipeptidase 2 n=1 Tax=Sporormia fimetaria CBS 119925 TaxID=1340428 RepID=A0A6A6VEP4_9PLEO|nr:N-acetylated-alpha-linked acidic dipeptidase 2 [Sporormia fimetaria CBS 119925]